jgi:xanthine dehydrogenase accessory factor
VVLEHLCVIRGGGDLATGVAWRLTTAGFPVIATELGDPLTVRRTVAVSSAVSDGHISIEGMRAVKVESAVEAIQTANEGTVAVLVSRELPEISAAVVIDARLAKRNIDTTRDDAPLVIGLGPGFTAAEDCHAVIETMRGAHLGRCLWHGAAEPNTGVPGVVGGRDTERVLRAPAVGRVNWATQIGDVVQGGQILGAVGDSQIRAPFDGVIRGLIRTGTIVETSLKVGDVDPRLDAPCHEISDKALAVGGGVLEAVMTWLNRDR